MVANNVNHAKWATGESGSGFSLESEEWSRWGEGCSPGQKKKKKLNSFIPPLSNVHIMELEMWGWGWGVCRGSPAYYYTLDRPTIPLLPCPCLKQMNPRWVMVSVCLGVKCMMNYAYLMVVLQKTPALHCHLWFPVCSLRAGNVCRQLCLSKSESTRLAHYPQSILAHCLGSLTWKILLFPPASFNH